MKRTYEIHCPECGVLLRRFAKQPDECPDCGNKQAVALLWMPPASMQVAQ